jgi:hypothetical protein
VPQPFNKLPIKPNDIAFKASRFSLVIFVIKPPRFTIHTRVTFKKCPLSVSFEDTGLLPVNQASFAKVIVNVNLWLHNKQLAIKRN